ncbi:hypothetical protein THUN1379_24760 [Paludibacterium sp. THUN1379]|uniref:hypothetical protein n=1 Tax=Paludibacterium sp. THUN1379 TaxID=3112107 RepID=UPI0030903725|nr:hypothetical protein THUN1379_24760 [Paludibacterium sp. THUN1379]
MDMSEICCLSESAPVSVQGRLTELARLTQLLAERGLDRMPLIELRRVLQLEGIRLAALDLSPAAQAALPFLSRLAYGEICRRLLD